MFHITKPVSRMKIKKQMYFIFIPLIIIPVLFIGTYLTTFFMKALYKQTSTQLESDNIRVKSIMLDCLINVYNISTDLISDNMLKSILTTTYLDEKEANNSLNNYNPYEDYVQNYSFISSITVYTDNTTLPETKYIKHINPSIYKQLVSKVLIPSSCKWAYSSPDTAVNPARELMLIRSFQTVQSKYKAIVVIKISNNFIKNRIQNNDLYTAISLNNNPVFFSTTRSMQGQPQDVPIDYNTDYYQYKGLFNFQDANVLGHVSSLPVFQSKDKLYITTIDFEAYRNITKIMIMCIAIISLAIFIPLSGILLYTKFFSTRVNSLRTAMRSAAMGNFDVIETLRGDDELTETFADLQYMITTLKQKEAAMFESKLKEKELLNQQQRMEFKILSSQINPHFLYNTLETIRMLAIDAGTMNIASAIKLLGKSMHYVLENAETFSTTLKNELDYIDVYLQIQKLRFEERLDYKIELPDDFSAKDYQILPLLLQPIVENAVLHGLENVSKNGYVSVIINTDFNTKLFIDILDNGTGMTSDKLNHLNRLLTDNIDYDADRSSIGLSNITRRIRLFYGESYYMKIISSTEKGTHVQLVLPLIPNQ